MSLRSSSRAGSFHVTSRDALRDRGRDSGNNGRCGRDDMWSVWGMGKLERPNKVVDSDRISAFKREILTIDSGPCLPAGTPKLKAKVVDCHIA
jgi:hypothetical protein